jgi:type I restriction enzyme M protein
MTNPSDKYIREFLINNYQIISWISLPEGAFKGAGTGVKTGILFVKKIKNKNNYNIFVATLNKLGFNFKSKTLEKIYLKNIKNGEFELNENNEKIIDSDFENIILKFKQFIFDNNLDFFESYNSKVEYSVISKNKLLEDKNLMLSAERFEKKYLEVVERIKLTKHSTLEKYYVSNEKTFDNVLEKKYYYLDISNLEKGSYILQNDIYGWELPNRAKQSVKKYDIVISKLQGSLDKFCIILNDEVDNIVLTNGCYKITIDDETTRLSFYRFLFTKEYSVQMWHLATGSIMLDIKVDDIKNNLYFPILEEQELNKMKDFIKNQEFFINLRNNF